MLYYKKAFSLVELSIAIVIIALLVSSVTVSNNLIKQARIQSTIRQATDYKLAYNNFLQTYDEIPGDFTSAHFYWDDGSNNICGTSSECNGDGDKMIELGTDKNSSEMFRAWQHLSLSTYVKREYIGVWGDAASIPHAKIKDGNFSLTYDNDIKQNILKLGTEVSFKGENSDGGILYPLDAYDIDNKIDDANPNRGEIRSISGYLGRNNKNTKTYDTNCISSKNNKKYKINYTDSKSCVLIVTLTNTY